MSPRIFTDSQRSLWLRASLDGFECGKSGGFLEQVPYRLNEPLFDAWVEGWREGVLKWGGGPCPPNIREVLTARWRQVLSTLN